MKTSDLAYSGKISRNFSRNMMTWEAAVFESDMIASPKLKPVPIG